MTRTVGELIERTLRGILGTRRVPCPRCAAQVQRASIVGGRCLGCRQVVTAIQAAGRATVADETSR